MKNSVSILFVAALMTLTSCGGGNTSKKKSGTMFNPQAKEQSMTDEERQAAIAAKRAELAEIDTAVIFGSGIKLTVMSPLPDGENYVTQKMSDDLAMRMLSIASKNGISGMGGDPTFVFLAGITGADKKLTGTAPQKTMITYDLALYVGNIISGEVYGSYQMKLVGVGSNETQAANQAAKELKDNIDIQKMLKTAGERIVTYYNNHASQIKADIQTKIAANSYEEAYMLMRSVPEEATAIFPWVAIEMPKVGEKIMLKNSAESFGQLKAAIAAGDAEFNPATGALLAMIPSNAPEYAEAHKVYDQYINRLRQQADDKNAWERQQAERQQAIDHEANMKQMEMDAKIAASSAKRMSSAEMRRQISLEDAAGSPFKMLWRKAGYALNDFFGGFGS